MFTGSVCSQVREWFKANASAFAGKRILSGCWGNFTIETVLSQAAERPAEIVSSDVSLYSSALGIYFTEGPPLKVTPRSDEWDWTRRYLSDAEALAGTMIVFLEAAPYSSGRTAYHRRMLGHYLGGFAAMHEQAVKRLRVRKQILEIARYEACDVRAFVAEREDGDIFLSFMPTYAGGYERLYKFVDAVFDWDGRPQYEVLDAKKKASLLEDIRQVGRYVHVDDMRRDGMGVVAIIEGGRGRPVYVHSNLGEVQAEAYRRSRTVHTKPDIAILGPEERIESTEITFVMLTANEFAWVRDQHLNPKIIPADPSWRFGVCVRGVLIGVLGWARDKGGVEYYLMCDLAVKSQVYARLSKLICLVANTREMHKVLRQQTGRLWHTFSTTAFTDKPVSMKYRGVLKLRRRNQKEGTLTYEGDYSGTLNKAVKRWRKLEKIRQG